MAAAPPLSILLGVERQGRDAYGRSKHLSANPRVRAFFADLEALKAVRVERLARLAGSPADPPVPTVYDLRPFQVVECYVCGRPLAADEAPGDCPECGAPPYAFHVELSERAVVELALAAEEAALKLFKELTIQVTAAVREPLRELLDDQEALVADLGSRRERLAAARP